MTLSDVQEFSVNFNRKRNLYSFEAFEFFLYDPFMISGKSYDPRKTTRSSYISYMTQYEC